MSNEKPNMRELSRTYFTSGQGNTCEAIQTGSLQRIADATELIAKNYQELIDERDRYKKYYQQRQEAFQTLIRVDRSRRAWTTKLKNQLNHLKVEKQNLQIRFDELSMQKDPEQKHTNGLRYISNKFIDIKGEVLLIKEFVINKVHSPTDVIRLLNNLQDKIERDIIQ